MTAFADSQGGLDGVDHSTDGDCGVNRQSNAGFGVNATSPTRYGLYASSTEAASAGNPEDFREAASRITPPTGRESRR